MNVLMCELSRLLYKNAIYNTKMIGKSDGKSLSFLKG